MVSVFGVRDICGYLRFNFIGNLVSGIFGYQGQRETNAANVALSREQMDFQERMSGTAYQRAVTDMSAAGLNPMLAYSQGGASSPPGAMAVQHNPAAAALSSAAQAQSMENVAAQTEKLRAESENVKADTTLKGAQTGLTAQLTQTSGRTSTLLYEQADKVMQEVVTIKAARRLLEQQISTQEFEVAKREMEAKLVKFEFEKMQPVELRKLIAQAELLGLEIPKAANEAAAEATMFKRYVSPFLGDAGRLGSSAAGIRFGFFGLRRR